MNYLFPKAKELIDNARHIALSTHTDPDLDGLGSLLALESALRDAGKDIIAFIADPVSEALKFLPHQKIVHKLNPEKIDLIIGLDYGSPERLEILNIYPEIQAKILTFDHHAVGQHLGLKIVDGDTSSTAEIIFNFMNYLGLPINSIVAGCLLAGIISDTGGFRHVNTSAKTLKAASELMLKGASLQRISQAINNLNNIDKKLSAITNLFKKIRVVPKVNFAYIIVNRQLFLSSSVGMKEIDVAGILSTVPETKIAATLTEKTPGILEVSMRSQPDSGINIALIAEALGGGGHRLAAGFTSNKTPEEIIDKIEKMLSAATELNE